MTTYTLSRPPAAPPAPVLDPAQQAVVDHKGGPLLVLAGPGTGKTTTMVETILDLVERRGVAPHEILALTFSRKAAEQLRDRVTARLHRTLDTTLSTTFHSFAYSLLRAHADEGAYAAPLRLLSAPVQDVVLQTLLRPSPEAVDWPPALADAVRTRGFSREVQALLARTRERGLTGEQLAGIGRSSGRPEWVAGGRFLEQYLDVLDAESAVDYADLIVRAVRLAEDPAVQADLRMRWSWVFVDEYQDTDPSQVALLRALAGDGRNLVVVGDPDQAIYGFRGADVRGVLDFPADFPTLDGRPAPVLALTRTRRFGPAIKAASERIATGIPVRGAIPSSAFEAFRRATAEPVEHGDGTVEVLHLDSPRAEVEHVADRLRRAHLQDGTAWSQMAVLVRSGRSSIPVLRRALTAAGVPVEVAADDTPLVDEPAVQPLLEALRVVLALEGEPDAGVASDAGPRPPVLDADKAETLLLSPLGGLDAAELRRLARSLHRRERTAAAARGVAARASTELVREAVLDPAVLEGLPRGSEIDKTRRFSVLLRRARGAVDAGAAAEEVLWLLWSGTGWPERLRHTALGAHGGSTARAAAHRDLDAVCALFEEAAKTEEQRGHTSVATFLDTLQAQQLPADTLAERGVRGEAVRLLTAHRAKGLEWDLVVVAQVQEGSWPDLRRRTSLLRADEVGHDGPLPPVDTRTLLAEERRLFYVACTRARRHLLVTAVASPDEDGDRPSRFTGELGVPPVEVTGRPPRPMSLTGVVAELRRTAADPSTPPALRDAAVRRLARLALERRGSAALVPAADPSTWWGTRGRSVSSSPIRAVDEPISLSPSTLDALLACPARWFLEHEAGGRTATTSAQGFGNIVHALADRLTKGELGPDTTEEQLMALVDRVWGEVVFATPWSSAKQRVELERALRRLLAWHREDPRRPLASEVPLDAELRLGPDPDSEMVRLHGYADRLDLDEDGRVVVVDFKTSKSHPTVKDLPEHVQLALYQLAVEQGAVDELLGRPGRSGGAELVQLRRDTPTPEAKVQRQEPPEPGPDGRTPVEVTIGQVVRRIRDEEFPARLGEHCKHCTFLTLCPHESSGTVLS